MDEFNQDSANDLGLLDLLEQADLIEGDNGDKNTSRKSFEDQKEFLVDHDDVVPSTFVNMKKSEAEKSNKFDENFDKENLIKADGNNRKRKSM